MTANNETGVAPAAGRRRRRGAPPRPAGVRLHRRRAGGAVPRPGRGGGRRGPGVAQRAQGRRAGRRRCAGGAARGRRSRRASTVAGRSASGAAGPRTWRARSGWPPRCAWWRPSAPRRPTRVAALRDRLGDGLLASVPGAHRTVPAGVAVLPGHLHLCVPGVEREELLVALGQEGVCVSGGSSCASGALEPSHVLAAMGVAPELAAGALRFTLGYWHHRGRRGPRPGRRPRRGRGAASAAALSPGGTLVPCGCWWPCRGASTPRSRRRSWSEQGHDVVGATLKLWGGPSDSGCCSVADVDDARRVAQQLGIAHHVFNLTEEFDRHVVAPYVGEHARGRTPNPCIECNRSMKFDRLLRRADRLGFDRLATGPPRPGDGRRRAALRLRRGADAAKDQSYVLSMLGQDALAARALPGRGHDQGRGAGPRAPTRPAHRRQARQPGRVLHRRARRAGRASCPGGWSCTRARWSTARAGPAGVRRCGRARHGGAAARHGPRQRRQAALRDPGRRGGAPGHRRRARRRRCARRSCSPRPSLTWVDRPLDPGVTGGGAGQRARAPGALHGARPTTRAWVRFDAPQRPVAPGQTVALYDALDPDAVVGAGIAA